MLSVVCNAMDLRHEQVWRCVLLSGGKRWLYMRAADHITGEHPNDLWFDRLLYVHHEGKYDRINRKQNETLEDLSVTLNGVIISDTLVLTSLNPFRNIIRFLFKRYFTTACALNKRRYGSFVNNKPYYLVDYYKIVCARPVIPLRDSETEINMWNGFEGYEKLHTPLHDLIVFRIHKPFENLLTKNNYPTTDSWRNRAPMDWLDVGPIMTYLAKEGDILGKNMKFGMLGDKLSTKMIIRRNLYARTFEPDEKVITNCDAWIPRQWGWFICLDNVDNLKRLASGAMLYSDDKLFGVGSFALFKGNRSVLVFTDVRYYWRLIINVCTDKDRRMEPPDECLQDRYYQTNKTKLECN